MSKRIRRRFAAVSLSLVLTLGLIELGLRIVDPAGLHYLDDVHTYGETLLFDESGYAIPSGQLALSHWSYTINEDGTRHTPNAVPDGPRVNFYGDSITFAWGVNDTDVWVNLVAGRLSLGALNYGRAGYSASNSAQLIELTGRTGCAIFFTIVNDIEPFLEYGVASPQQTSSLMFIRYISLVLNHPDYNPPVDEEGWQRSMEAIAARPNTLILAFEGSYGDVVAQDYGAQLIPMYAGRISNADAHANEAGNRQIADSATPIIKAWLEGRECE